jgi:hypothetical protein
MVAEARPAGCVQPAFALLHHEVGYNKRARGHYLHAPLGSAFTEELLAKVRGPQGAQQVEQAQALLERAKELRQRAVSVYDKAHGSAVDRERQRLLSTGLYGSGARR